MGTKRTNEFRADAVRIALTSGLTRRQVASDLGVGLSTLNKWLTAHRDTDVVSDKELDLARENERLRRENRILKEERDILKGHGLLREPKAMRFLFIHCPAVETQFRREGKSMAAMPDQPSLPGPGCQRTRFSGLSQPSGQSKTARIKGSWAVQRAAIASLTSV